MYSLDFFFISWTLEQFGHGFQQGQSGGTNSQTSMMKLVKGQLVIVTRESL